MNIEIKLNMTREEEDRVVRHYLQNRINKKDIANILKDRNINGRSKLVNFFGRKMYRKDPVDNGYKYMYSPEYSEDGQLEVAKLLNDLNHFDINKLVEDYIDKYSTNHFWRLKGLIQSAKLPDSCIRVTITTVFPDDDVAKYNTSLENEELGDI